ncbi:hypothetical protein [Kineococcus sp. R86509]|uniref:hypothetical protein n=1 Tax=Kineococcus sp. R86509 TaxID=3093851 RepID=UPI0036D3867E
MESLPGGRAEALPAHWDELAWPRPTPAALLTVLVWAVRPPVRPTAGVVGAPRRQVGRRVPSRRVAPEVDVSLLPDYGRLRSLSGVAAMSAEEFGDNDAFVTEMWLRSWVRRHRSVAVRAWLRAQHPGVSPEVVTGTVREMSVELALAVGDVGVLVVGLREGWSEEWMVAVQEAGFGAEEALALAGREDGWEVVRTMVAFSGSASR